MRVRSVCSDDGFLECAISNTKPKWLGATTAAYDYFSAPKAYIDALIFWWPNNASPVQTSDTCETLQCSNWATLVVLVVPCHVRKCHHVNAQVCCLAHIMQLAHALSHWHIVYLELQCQV